MASIALAFFCWISGIKRLSRSVALGSTPCVAELACTSWKLIAETSCPNRDDYQYSRDRSNNVVCIMKSVRVVAMRYIKRAIPTATAPKVTPTRSSLKALAAILDPALGELVAEAPAEEAALADDPEPLDEGRLVALADPEDEGAAEADELVLLPLPVPPETPESE